MSANPRLEFSFTLTEFRFLHFVQFALSVRYPNFVRTENSLLEFALRSLLSLPSLRCRQLRHSLTKFRFAHLSANPLRSVVFYCGYIIFPIHCIANCCNCFWKMLLQILHTWTKHFNISITISISYSVCFSNNF